MQYLCQPDHYWISSFKNTMISWHVLMWFSPLRQVLFAFLWGLLFCLFTGFSLSLQHYLGSIMNSQIFNPGIQGRKPPWLMFGKFLKMWTYSYYLYVLLYLLTGVHSICKDIPIDGCRASQILFKIQVHNHLSTILEFGRGYSDTMLFLVNYLNWCEHI